MFRKLGAAVAAITLSFAGSASAAVVWQGPASAIWALSQTESYATVSPRVVPFLDEGKTYQIHFYGPGLISSGGIILRQSFHYDEDLIFDGQLVHWGNSVDVYTFFLIDNTPEQFVSNGIIIYATVPPNSSWSTVDYHYQDYHFADFTIYTEYYGRNLDGLYTLDISVVPEPSTWAMMIAGFGLAGSALRRRRLQAA